jgi:hypothetical protein
MAAEGEGTGNAGDDSRGDVTGILRLGRLRERESAGNEWHRGEE